MFSEQRDVNFAAYADDNTPYFYDKNLEVQLQTCALKLLEWFSNNYMKKNSGKSSVIWQKGESQNGGNKNTKHAKFSEKRTFFTP